MIVLVLIWLLAFAFWYKNQEKKKMQNKKTADNYYIAYHQQKLKNDTYYEDYLKWCYKQNEIPMSKHKFIKEVENNEDKIKDLLK